MKRCSQSAGFYRVTFRVANAKVERQLQIVGHDHIFALDEGRLRRDVNDAPIIIELAPILSNQTPFEGELCAHELEALQRHPENKIYPLHYEFTITPLKKPADATP